MSQSGLSGTLTLASHCGGTTSFLQKHSQSQLSGGTVVLLMQQRFGFLSSWNLFLKLDSPSWEGLVWWYINNHEDEESTSLSNRDGGTETSCYPVTVMVAMALFSCRFTKRVESSADQAKYSGSKFLASVAWLSPSGQATHGSPRSNSSHALRLP